MGLRAERVLDASPNPIVAVDGLGRIVYASPTVREAFGWAPDELLGEAIEVLVPENIAGRHASVRASYGRHPTPRAIGTRAGLAARRRDGTEFPAEISLAIVPSRHGRLVFATIVDITARRSLQDQLEQATVELRRRADELEQRGREMALLSRMRALLESCETLEEAYSVIAGIAEQLFAGDAGAVYSLVESRAVAESVAAWGDPRPTPAVFRPADCWALRRGRLHVVRDGDPHLACAHVDRTAAADFLCQPLAAQAEVLGLLHVQLRRRPAGADEAAILADRTRLVEVVGEQVALALANIRLRAVLREQSSRDPLTGLFNRRHMEESLDREIRRAAREGYGLGVLMADLDSFKQLNNAYGHAAGDDVLRRIGAYLAAAVRGGDVACRFGGEEFVLILPKATLEDTVRRAEALREGIKVHQQGDPARRYPTVSISIGVASYPVHGSTVDQLVAAADGALYRAKARGRDQVAVADGPGEGRTP